MKTTDQLLTGKSAVITGGAGVIGAAIAEGMAQRGADVAIADVDGDQASIVAERIALQYGVQAIGIAADVTDLSSLESTADHIETRVGVCDVVVVNAGILILKPAIDITAQEWNTVISVNLTGAFHTAAVFARRLERARRPGSIIFNSSLFGVRGGRGNSAYSASKFGLIGVAQCMAAELAPLGIRVNAVCPGQIETTMIEALFARRAEENDSTPQYERDQFVQKIPMGRLGAASDVADVFVYLASDMSAYVTGQSMVVDGGWQVA